MPPDTQLRSNPSALPSAGWRGAGYLFLVCAAAWYTWENFVAIRSGMARPSDFTHYYDAGKGIIQGATPYSDPFFLYPALVAFAATPFALTSYITARWIWFFASHVMLLGAGILVWRFLGGGLAAACCAALVWAGGGAAKESLALGQMGPLLALLLALAYTSRGTVRGLAAGTGTALKLMPGILVLPMALAREWRTIFAMMAAGVVLMGVPSIALLGFDGPKAPPGASYLLGTPAILSWSVPSTVLRALDPPQANGALPGNWETGNRVTELKLPSEQRMEAAGSGIAVMAIGALLLVWRTRGSIGPEQLPVTMAGVLALALSAAPVCWSHYQILQYPGLAILLGLAVQQRQWTLAGALVFCGALLYPLPVAVLTDYYHRYGWTAASPWQLYVWTSVTPVSSLGIFGLSLYTLRAQPHS